MFGRTAHHVGILPAPYRESFRAAWGASSHHIGSLGMLEGEPLHVGRGALSCREGSLVMPQGEPLLATPHITKRCSSSCHCLP
eukprot:366466-Chlamydomonas_euryale.AAC.17